MKDGTMKKTMIFAAVAALVSLASCQKEEAINNGTDKNASPVFTASIAGATKTTIDMTDGNVAKIAWETTDEITVTDAAKSSAVYTIKSIDATTGKATFVIKTGETALGDGPYTATYGTAPATAQTYSATAGKLYMTAPETSNNSFTFTVQCGLMKLNLTKPDESVKSIAVTGTPTGGSETTYTLTCDPAQSIATAKDFFIALPDGSYTKIEITNAEDITCTLNSTNGVEVAANHIKPVTFGESKIKFAPAIPDGALSGVFSVSATKKVYFSQGNLTYNVSTTTWAFYEHQYDCATGYDANLISLFTWGYNATSSIVPDGKNYVSGHNTDGESFNADEDWGTQIGDGNTWRTLSTAEWEWLLGPSSSPTPGTNCRTSSTVNGTANARYLRCKVKDVTRDVYGLMIFPDTFTWPTGTDAPSAPTGSYINDNDLAWESVPGYTSSQFEALEKAGVVFLPAAGYRNGTSVYNVGKRGYSWSSTAGSSIGAYALYFSEGNVNPADGNNRGSGRSVRLVSVVQ